MRSRVNDELPERFTHDDIRAANAKHWQQPRSKTSKQDASNTQPPQPR